MCVGNKEANLVCLGSLLLGPDTDSVAAQLWELMQSKWPMALLVEILDAIEILPWSSQVCEEAHAAAAVMMRFHPDLHEDTLCCIAMLYSTKPLLGRSDTELLVERL